MFNVSVLSWPRPSAAPPTDIHVWVYALAAYTVYTEYTLLNINCAFAA